MPPAPRRGRAFGLVAVGKASPIMAEALLSTPLGGRIERALVVAPDGTPASFEDPRVELLRAAHPDPDRRSVLAARRALDLVRHCDWVLALISGGASSLICSPEGVSLARYVRVVRAVLLGGATVREVNVVRRHLCAVKGGGLALAAGGPVATLIVSDVVAGTPHDVGSGPTVADPTTCADASEVLRRFAPRLPIPAFRESLKPSSREARGLSARVVASPEDLSQAVAGALRARGMAVRILPSSIAASAELCLEYAARARRLRPGEALVRSAEPSLRMPHRQAGRGGRCTHLATLLAGCLPDGVAFLAGASDGVDGTSGTGGAVVDNSLVTRTSHLRVQRALASFDTGPLLRRAAMSLPGLPSGYNFADVHVLARTCG